MYIFISNIDIMKILISWMAFNSDFTKNGNVETENSPNYNMHKYYWDYDKHVILCSSAKEDIRLEKLENKLRLDFPDHEIEAIYMGISDIIDINEIKVKIETLLLSFKDDSVTIFFSPGTSAMQVAWYICHTTLQLNTKLVQMRPATKSKSRKNELIEIITETSSLPVTSILKELIVDQRDRINTFDDFKYTDSILPVYNKADKIANTDRVTVLINGETGTGKEHLASYIHKNSVRAKAPFIAINCSALNDELLTAELFGYKKGSYSFAYEDRKGLFERADKGTIFLDEIGDISPKLQQTLLRVLQEKEIQPLQKNPIKVDVRVIAATNKNLPELCKAGIFRWDLYYRLAIAELELPSLMARGSEEIDEMIDFFLVRKMKELRKKSILKLSADVRQLLRNHTWPGNVRELENLIETLYVFCETSASIKDLPERFKNPPSEKSLKWKDVEKEHIKYVLRLKKGNQRQASLALDYGSINTLRKNIALYKIRLDNFDN